MNAQVVAGGIAPDGQGPALRRYFSGRRLVWAALFVILSLALALRLYGINWDQGGLFHPDERAILMRTTDLEFPAPSEFASLLDAEESPLNPGWFNYGSLPLYALRALQGVASPFTDWNVFDLRIPGRVMSALADTATVGLIFVLGRAWLGTRVGLLTALFAALAVIGIQLSHFFAVDTILALFITTAIFFSVRVAYGGRRRDSVLAGLFVGLAIATKASAAVLGAPVLAAHLIYAFSAPGDSFRFVLPRDELGRRVVYLVRSLILSGGVALAALLITQPYMFLDFETFRTDITDESAMVRRDVDLPYTRQYIDTPRYLYQFWQLGTYGLGPFLGALSWAGLAAAAVIAWRQRRKFDLVVLGWLVPYLLIIGWFEVKFLRYMLPALPFLLLYAARLAWWGFDWLRSRGPRFRYAGPIVIGLIVAATAHYALSYETIYTRPHTAQEASAWLRENADFGSLLLKEHWEEGLPNLPGMAREELQLYDPDSESKFIRIASQLGRGDFLVLYSKRLYATVPRLPDRYPASEAYYTRLFDGSLGYELVHVSESVPGALGVTYDEDTFGRTAIGPPDGYSPTRGALATVSFGWADESFTVYDHPKTLIFQNVERLPMMEIFERVWARPVSERTPGLLLSKDDAAVQVAGGTYSDIVQHSAGSDSYSWIVWLLAAEVIGLAALPLGLVLFRPLAGRGYLLTKTLGLLLVSFAAWLMASVGVMEFSRASVVVALVIVATISAIVAWRERDDLVAFLRENRRFVLGMEALFLVAFFAFLAIRVANPDLWHPFRGGEKPMDFAYLNAVTRSTVMPPYDPWFAGGFLNYYYFGQFIVASLIRLTGIAPAVAYNLAVPLLFALTAGGAFAIVYALAEGARRAVGGASRYARGPVFAGLGAAVLVTVAGNIDGLIQVFQGASRALISSEAYGTFDYWRSSRMFAPGSPGNEITEFPFFTFLFADLHAHLIAIPFTLLALGLAVAMFLGAWRGRRSMWQRWGGSVVLGLVIGGLRITNAWDYPTYLGLAVAALVGGELLGGQERLAQRLGRGVLMAAAMAAVSYVAYLPFHLNFQLFNDGIIRSATQTPLWRYWAIHAPFLFLILSYIVWQGRAALGAAARRLRLGPEWLLLILAIAVTFAVTVGIVGYATVAFTVAVIAIVAALGVIGIAAPSPRMRFELVVAAFVVVALAIGAGVDIFTVKNDIGRLNTVFKFYLQAWVLLALASAYIGWRFADAGMFALRRGLSLSRGVWIVGAAALAIAVLVYPVLGTQARLRDRFETDRAGIDGMAFMDNATQFERSTPIQLRHDLEAIRWLQENVDGSPTIVEGLTDLYHWGNRVSIYTGLPAVVGWDWHQRQQRVEYAWAVTERRQDVDQIYTTTNPHVALQLMRSYGVRYLYLGELERLYYPETGIAKFAEMESLGLVPVYTSEEVVIYELNEQVAQAGSAVDSSDG